MRFAEGHVTGFDMTAALAMASALGVCERATAELLPLVESEMVAAIRAQERTRDGA